MPLETNAKPIGSAGLNAQKFAGAKIGAHRADPAMLSGASGGSTIGAMVQKALDPQSNAAEVKTESEFTPMIQRLMALAAGAIQGKEAGGQESEEKHSDAEEGNAGGDLEPKAHQAALEKRESATAAVAGGVSSISVGLLAIQAAASVTKSEIEKTKRRRAMEIASKVFSGLSIAASLAGTVLEQVKVATAAIPILGTVSGAMGLFDFLAKLIGGQANNPSAEDTIEGVKDDLPPMWGRWIEAHRKLVRRATIASNYLSLVSSLLGVAAGILTMTGVGAVALPVLGGLAFVLAGAALILNPVSIIGPAIKIYKTAKRVLQRARSAWEALTGTIKQKKQNFADYGKKMQEQYRQWAEAKKAELWSWILKKKDQLADTIREKAAWIAGLIRGKKDDLQGWISKKTSAIYKMLPAAAKRVWDWVAQKRDEVFAWIAERKAWLDQWAGVKRLMFQLWIEQKKQQAIQWILDKKDTIQEWLGAKKQSLLEWAIEKKNEFKEWFLDKYGSFKEWWGTKKGDLVGWADGKWHPKKPSSPKPGGAADSEPGETPTKRPRGGFGTRIAEMLKRSGVGRPVSPLGSVGKAALEMARRAAERGQGIVGRGLGLLGQGVRRVGQFVVQGAQRVGEFVGEQAQRAREGVGQVLGTVGRAVGQGLGLVGRAIGGVVGAGVERALEFGQEVGERVTRRIQGAFPRAANDGALTGPFMPGGVPVEDDREAEELHGSRTDSEARGAIGNGATIFVNGIDTSISEHFRAAQRLANQLNTPVVGVYNASTGFGSDLLQCFSDKMFDAGRLVGRGNPAVETLRRIMVRHGNPREENGGLRIFAHSQGSIIVSEALRQARGEGADISQHDVTTFGNAAFSFPTGPQYHHYVHDDDLVSTGVGTTSIVSRIMNQTWPGRFLRDRLLGPSTDPQASTVVMHQGGSFIRPHSVNDPSGTNDYIGNLPEFRRREGMGMPAGTAMPTTTRSLMATGFGITRGIGGAVADMVGTGYNAVDRSMRAMPNLPFLPGFMRWNSLDRGFRGAGGGLMAMGGLLGRLNDSFFHRVNAVQRAEVAGAGPAGDVDADLMSARVQESGPGSALDSGLRGEMEPHVGGDLSMARIHTGPAAASLAGEIGARAFTVGRDVVFAANQYDPSTASGQALLAHELTHVVQQTGQRGDKARFFTERGGDEMEQEAQQTAERFLASRGRRDGLFVENFHSLYEALDAGVTPSELERLDRIGDMALLEAQRMMSSDGRMGSASIESVEIDLELDLTQLSDQEAAILWGQAIVDSMRLRVMAAAGLAEAPPPSAATPTPAAVQGFIVPGFGPSLGSLTDPWSWIPGGQVIKWAIGDDSKSSERGTLEKIGVIKGVVGELTGIIDTLLWVEHIQSKAFTLGAEGVIWAAKKTGVPLPIKDETLIKAAKLMDDLSPSGQRRKMWEQIGLASKDKPMSITESVASAFDWGAAKYGKLAGVDPNKQEFWVFSAYEIGELEGSIATQVALAAIGAKEVQIALNIIGAAGNVKSIAETIEKLNRPNYKATESDYKDLAVGLFGLFMSVLGIKGSKAWQKLGAVAIPLLQVGTVMLHARELYNAIYNPDKNATPEERQKRIVAATKALLGAIKDVIMTIIDKAKSRPRKQTGEEEGGTTVKKDEEGAAPKKQDEEGTTVKKPEDEGAPVKKTDDDDAAAKKKADEDEAAAKKKAEEEEASAKAKEAAADAEARQLIKEKGWKKLKAMAEEGKLTPEQVAQLTKTRNAIQEAAMAQVLKDHPTVAPDNKGTTGFTSDVDITFLPKEKPQTPEQIGAAVRESGLAAQKLMQLMREQLGGADPGKAIDTNAYTYTGGDALANIPGAKTKGVAHAQDVTALAAMKRSLMAKGGEKAWTEYKQQLMKRLTSDAEPGSTQAKVEAEARNKLEQQLKDADAMFERTEKARREGSAEAKAGDPNLKGNELVKALGREKAVQKLNQELAAEWQKSPPNYEKIAYLHGEIKLLEPGAYATAAAKADVVDFQQALKGKDGKALWTEIDPATGQPKAKKVVALTELAQSAQDSVSQLIDHTRNAPRTEAEALAQVDAAIKYSMRVAHANEVAGSKSALAEGGWLHDMSAESMVNKSQSADEAAGFKKAMAETGFIDRKNPELMKRMVEQATGNPPGSFNVKMAQDFIAKKVADAMANAQSLQVKALTQPQAVVHQEDVPPQPTPVDPNSIPPTPPDGPGGPGGPGRPLPPDPSGISGPGVVLVTVSGKELIVDSNMAIAAVKAARDPSLASLNDREKLSVEFLKKNLGVDSSMIVTWKTVDEMMTPGGTGSDGTFPTARQQNVDPAEKAAILKELETASVGGGKKGANDRELVAQVLTAETQNGAIPTLATADDAVINGLARLEEPPPGGAKMNPSKGWGKHKNCAEFLKAERGSESFVAIVNGRRVRVIPVQPVRSGP